MSEQYFTVAGVSSFVLVVQAGKLVLFLTTMSSRAAGSGAAIQMFWIASLCSQRRSNDIAKSFLYLPHLCLSVVPTN
ncbi:MAG: hypothetical protein IIB46_08105 [Nitrospinae bacterium]|nr:hypothetical protein [Nitrospinota bacterium]